MQAPAANGATVIFAEPALNPAKSAHDLRIGEPNHFGAGYAHSEKVNGDYAMPRIAGFQCSKPFLVVGHDCAPIGSITNFAKYLRISLPTIILYSRAGFFRCERSRFPNGR